LGRTGPSETKYTDTLGCANMASMCSPMARDCSGTRAANGAGLVRHQPKQIFISGQRKLGAAR
jgi:hypothetical protein